MKKDKAAIFDTGKARTSIETGRRGGWLQRKGTKKRGFSYLRANGKKNTDKSDLERIESLVIPPAWKHVRINTAAGGKIQAIGMDTTGRVQYIYHPKFAERQQRQKFAKLNAFGEALPKLMDAVNRDIELEGLPAERVLAVVMRLMSSLYFRVGSDLSEKHYKTYGITTLQKKHLEIGNKGKLTFSFVGKSHVDHRRILVDSELAAVIKQITSLKRGRKLFRYLDESGKPRAITPSQINSYIKNATDAKFSSKDFRTWGGTLLAAIAFAEEGPHETESENKKAVVKIVKRVADELGNTPAVCRSSYIHPAVLKAYSDGVTIDEFLPRKQRKIKRLKAELLPEEKALIKLLKSYE
jgi:DNA topoisomerase-1